VSASFKSATLDFRENSSQNRVLFATYKYLWAIGEKEKALEELTSFLDEMNSSAIVVTNNGVSSENARTMDMKAFRVKCLLKRAEWLRESGNHPFSEVITAVLEARELSADQYSVWHAWAVTNYNQLQKVDAMDISTDKSTEGRESVSAPSAPATPSNGGPVTHVSFQTRSTRVSTALLQSTDGTKKPKLADTYRRSIPQGMTLANLLSVSQEADAMRFISEAIRL
jgi:hypothetical protein